MPLASAILMLLLAVAPGEKPALVVNAADTPVKLDKATIVSVTGAPPVLLYAAANQTADEIDLFMVIAFVFDAEGNLKARQTAPSRRTLEARSTKYSTLVLDGSDVLPTDIIVAGVSQAQRTGSETWWRTDLQAAATAAAKPKKH